MSIAYRVLVGSPLGVDGQRSCQEIIDAVFDEIDAVYNEWNPDSEISQLNQADAATPIPLSDGLEGLFTSVDDIVRLSGGKFDPTVEPLIRLWRENLEGGRIPSDADCAFIADSVGWDKIHHEDGLFSKDCDRTQISLSAIAKGLCVDMISERLTEAGYRDTFVEWGGEIRSHGHHPEGRPWRVLVTSDGSPSHATKVVDLVDQAIATSGVCHQQWHVEDSAHNTKTFTHIIDPTMQRPLEVGEGNIVSATVIAPTCALADSIATAAMLFPSVADAAQWVQELQQTHPQIQIWLFRSMTIQTLFCDIGNVLLFFDHNRGMKQVADLCAVDPGVIYELVMQEGLGEQYETGKISSEEACERILSVAKARPPAQAIIDAWCRIFKPNEPLFDVMHQLKGQGIRLILLSNIGDSYYRYITKTYPVFDCFDDAVLSYRVGAMKPDKKIFQAALDATSSLPEECFYLDDIQEFVDVAKEMGIDAEQYVDTPTLLKQLQERGLTI